MTLYCISDFCGKYLTTRKTIFHHPAASTFARTMQMDKKQITFRHAIVKYVPVTIRKFENQEEEIIIIVVVVIIINNIIMKTITRKQ
ncbi:hypothetical protein CHS0354_028481 [Potamilus streckersoni]|uniref:Uncharacterized protein n=1 Tax=Potamilus streckersoni TaxID=2493646 RepID=A0AAE0S7V3_9BIVA|nr:hypothetical protein CHS0354_028481 [Potamilus streckersoni]